MAFLKLKVLCFSESHLLTFFAVAGKIIEQSEKGRQVSLTRVNNLNAFLR